MLQSCLGQICVAGEVPRFPRVLLWGECQRSAEKPEQQEVEGTFYTGMKV